MLENNKKDILNNNYYLNTIKNSKTINGFRNHKTKVFFIGILIGLGLLLLLYFISDYSNVFHISITGNKYLSDEDILNISGIKENDKYLLVFPNIKKNNLESSDYIKEASVELLPGRIVKISVDEKKQIGYLNEAGQAKILFEDGEKTLLNKEQMYLINNIPLLEGFTATQYNTILKGFKNINSDILANISEIHSSPISFDQNRMEIIMRDGNYVYVSWTGLDLLKNYESIVTGLKLNGKNACIYLDEITNSGYVSACPWQ